MRKILAVAHKEVRQIVRDPLTLGMLLGLPAFMLVIFGYAISFDVDHVALGVQDRDRSPASRELIASFVTTDRFDLKAELETDAAIERAIEEARVQVVLVIPVGFGTDLAAGRRAAVQLLLDGTDSTSATTILGYATGVVAAVNARLRVARLRNAGVESALAAAIDYQPRVWYNPELNSSYFLVPGLIGFIMMITAVLSTALSVVREKERGTLEQLRVAPLATIEILLGKILPYLVISLLAMTLILTAARILFGVVVKGSYVDLFLVTLLFLLGAIGWGLLISTLVDSQAIAFQIGVMTALLPTLLLSGFIFPIRNMPWVLQLVTHIVPARYYLVTLRGIILKGSDLGPYWDQVGSLLLYTLVVITLASVRFARREA
ncbi:MAG: ABC transporter permease [bacterium]|nr:ABC transporter permease [bacterium]